MDKQIIIDVLKKSFVKENAKGINTSIQLNLSGEDGGTWYMLIKNRALGIEEGEYEDARATIDADMGDLLKIVSGELDPLKAFFGGNIQITGDMGAVMKLLSLFKLTEADYKKILGNQ